MHFLRTNSSHGNLLPGSRFARLEFVRRKYFPHTGEASFPCLRVHQATHSVWGLHNTRRQRQAEDDELREDHHSSLRNFFLFLDAHRRLPSVAQSPHQVALWACQGFCSLFCNHYYTLSFPFPLASLNSFAPPRFPETTPVHLFFATMSEISEVRLLCLSSWTEKFSDTSKFSAAKSRSFQHERWSDPVRRCGCQAETEGNPIPK